MPRRSVAEADAPALVPEVALWCAVMRQALADASAAKLRPPGSVGGDTYPSEAERDAARRWFLESAPAFIWTCCTVALDANAVRSRFRAQVALEQTLDRARAA